MVGRRWGGNMALICRAAAPAQLLSAACSRLCLPPLCRAPMPTSMPTSAFVGPPAHPAQRSKDPVCESCEEDAAKCQSCGSFSLTRGAYLDAQGRCSPCPQGCSSCDESGACSQCAPGYGFKGKACVR